MANAEQIFNDCTLDLVIPNGILPLPAQEDGASAVDEWLERAQNVGERKQAFFDEKLDFFLTVRFRQDTSTGLLSPDIYAAPPLLLSFLNHLQVSLEATYIPPAPPEHPATPTLSAPPLRSSSSLQTPKAKGLGIPLPLFPPQTPSPKPSTSETDRKYVYAEGTPLKSFIWGEDSREEVDSFRFLKSSSEKCWIAIYRIHLPVVYIRTEFENPLLCLTTSVTLRDKPLSPTPQRRTLLELIQSAGPLPPLTDTAPVKEIDVPTIIEPGAPGRVECAFLDEVNLLDGISCDDPSRTGDEDRLYLPTTRLGASTRRAYSLPPLSPASPTDPKPSPSRSLPVLRKSFRKTIGLASGFHVRMRTILVPQLYLPEETEEEQEATSDESTVVLSIEIENPGDSEAAFSVDAVEVYMRNEATKIRLIGWGEQGFSDPSKVFPLLIRPAEQYYLLYAVAFLRSPEFELSQGEDEYKKIVSFNIIGRPFTVPGLDHASVIATDNLTYLSSPFLSRWNCRLDLDPRRRESVPPPDTNTEGAPNAIPVSPSPFPVASPRTQQAQEQAAAQAALKVNTVAGPKRHTFAGTTGSSNLLSPQRPMSLTTSPFSSPGTSRIPSPLGKLGMKPWTVGTPLSTPGHLSPPLPPLPNGSPNQKNLDPPATARAASCPFPAPPQTPAFPSYGSQPMTPRPSSVTPSFGQMGKVGRDMDARRERLGVLPGMPVTPLPPMTPRPQLGVDERSVPPSYRVPGSLTPGAKDFVISISLIPPNSSDSVNDSDHRPRPRPRPIHPLDEFALEIFVFNQSPYVRTLEATLADRRRRREDPKRGSLTFTSSDVDTWKPAAPAFMALESRVRIGPLGPSTCQSVTIRFLAMLPGVHTIDGLILTDLDSGESISLRSVMDFAVLSRHSSEGEDEGEQMVLASSE